MLCINKKYSKFALFLKATSISTPINYSKLSGFLKLTKFRLGALVVFSAVITYLTVAASVEWRQLLALSIGGFLVTSAANGFNQIIEKDLDKLDINSIGAYGQFILV